MTHNKCSKIKRWCRLSSVGWCSHDGRLEKQGCAGRNRGDEAGKAEDAESVVARGGVLEVWILLRRVAGGPGRRVNADIRRLRDVRDVSIGISRGPDGHDLAAAFSTGGRAAGCATGRRRSSLLLRRSCGCSRSYGA